MLKPVIACLSVATLFGLEAQGQNKQTSEWKLTEQQGNVKVYTLTNLPSGQQAKLKDSAGTKTLFLESWESMDIAGKKVTLSRSTENNRNYTVDFTDIGMYGIVDQKKKSFSPRAEQTNSFVDIKANELASGKYTPKMLIGDAETILSGSRGLPRSIASSPHYF